MEPFLHMAWSCHRLFPGTFPRAGVSISRTMNKSSIMLIICSSSTSSRKRDRHSHSNLHPLHRHILRGRHRYMIIDCGRIQSKSQQVLHLDCQGDLPWIIHVRLQFHLLCQLVMIAVLSQRYLIETQSWYAGGVTSFAELRS